MKKILTNFRSITLIFVFYLITSGILAQNQIELLQTGQDTLKEKVSTIRDQISGIEERVATAEADLAKLTKIKLSGYIQAQYMHYEAANAYPAHLFMIRRARFKIQYEPVNGVVFVLQPDFVPGNISVKDAYLQLNDRWLKTFSLTAGKFNRPNYEVEYSSSSREVPERSRLIRAIYPDERAIGAKLEINPPSVPIKVQLALFNGNDGLVIPDASGVNVNLASNQDFDNHKDLMGRVTYNFRLGNIGALTIGAHGYYGKIKANTTDLLNSDYTYNKSSENIATLIRKNWAGAEFQAYFDFLGGLALKGEFIAGVNGTPGYTVKTSVASPMTTSLKNDTLSLTTLTTNTTNSRPAIEKNFMGGYLYLIKNIGKKHQVAVRYDYYDPNTKVKSDQIGLAKWDASKTTTANSFTYAGSDPVIATNTQTKTVVTNNLKSGTSDLKYHTVTMAYSYYFDDNIKIMLAYEIPMNGKVGVNTAGVGNLTSSYTVNGQPGLYDYSDAIHQNTLTLRLQVKF